MFFTSISVVLIEAKEPPQWLIEVREILDERFLERLTLTEIAVTAGLHPVYLTRVFRTYYGCNVSEYLVRQRLSHALALFENEALSLAEISIQAGFCDQSHFSKMFKRVYGLPPGSYRKARRQTSIEA